ncbi:MAG: DNA ligase-like domain-containing protein [Candidatus Dormibacteria bacterium]
MPRGRAPATQAPLALSLDDPAPAALLPELATPCAAPFDSDGWLFGIDWEGSRAMVCVATSGAVRLEGAMGPIDQRFPEVARAAAALPPGTTLDGVLTVLGSDGRPDLEALAARMAGSHRTAGVLLASDLLRAGGRSLVREPCENRLQRLRALLPGDPHLQAPELVAGQGVALATAATAQGLGTLLARRRGAPYTCGVPSPDRLRIDLCGSVQRVVVGRRLRPSGVEVLLGEVVDGRLTFVHTEMLEASSAVRRWFDRVAQPVQRPPCDQAAAAGAGVTWLRPRLCATVRDPSRAGGGAILTLRDDIDPRWCVRRDPVPPPVAAAPPQRAFTPTVLRGLPLDAA